MSYWLIALAFMLIAISGFMYSFGFNQKANSTAGSASAPVKQGNARRKIAEPPSPWIEWLQKNGFSRSPIKNLILLVCVLLIASVGYRLIGSFGALVSFVITLCTFIALARWRRTNIKLVLIQQLPSFIDHINRRIKIGMGIHQAIEQSSRTTVNPLREVLDRVNQRKAVGIELQDAFYKESIITGVHAFQLMGSIFSINTRFGGSIADSLESLVKLLRQQDLSRRELKSITGETRITAWVIGSAPILVGVYMMAQNPELILNMWYSDKGRYALILGGVMQSTGVFLIWRMFRTL